MPKILIFTILLILPIFSLTGCAHFIASQIAKQHQPDVDGNASDIFKVSRLCSFNSNCVNAQRTPSIEISNLKFTLAVNDKPKTWYFAASQPPIVKNKRHLIYVFPGFGTPKALVAMHQQWLHLVTGATVTVIESADSAEKFSFGLNAIDPVLHEIGKLEPLSVDIVGVSMGSIAAQYVASQIESAKLHLIAPMTDFNHSTLTLWDTLYKDRFYSTFISTKHVEEAVNIVYKNAGIASDDIDVIQRVKESVVTTFIYSSIDDKIALSTGWESLSNNNVLHHKFDSLSHLEMTALMDEDLLAMFLSNLTGNHVFKNASTTGRVCNIGEKSCLDIPKN